MNRSSRAMGAGLVLGWLFITSPPLEADEKVASDQPPRPNIVIIMSDDVGYSDLGCYGGEIRTPHLDQLASQGTRFTSFYNTGRCCPTRASLLTGLYPHQAGIGHMTNDQGYDGYRGDLNTSCRTIAEVLGPAGYKNYMVGKWHVTRFIGPNAPRHNWPLNRGFDRFYGMITGAGNYYDPPTLIRDDKPITIHTDSEYSAENYYLTTALSDQADRFIQDHHQSDPDKPFFLYLAYTAGHWPMHAPEADVAAYQGQYDKGYDAYRQARYAKMKELGVIPPGCELSDTVGDWDGFEPKAWEARCMEVYASMLTSMDRGIGQIVETLRETGRLDNTLIFYLQDNGGCAEMIGRGDGPAKAAGPTAQAFPPERIMTDLGRKQTRDGWPMRIGPLNMPGPEDTYIGYGRSWANVSNTPFRYYKHFVHEGGIATPLIMHWPDRLKVEPGGLCHDPSHLIDLMATCVEVSGASYPTEIDGRPITPLEGVSLVPALSGTSLDRKAPLFWEHEGNKAIRLGDEKLVAVAGKPWELYDLSTDRAELHNLADDRPERVRQLRAIWRAWAERANVLPVGAWKNANPAGRLPAPTTTGQRD